MQIKSWAKEHEDQLVLLGLCGSSVVLMMLFNHFWPPPDPPPGWRKPPPRPVGASDSVDVDADMNVDMMPSALDVPVYDAPGSPIELADTTITIPTAQGEFASGFPSMGGDGGLVVDLDGDLVVDFVEVDDGSLVGGIVEVVADILV